MKLFSIKRILFTFIFLFISFLCLEIFMRVTYFLKFNDIYWLIAPFSTNSYNKPLIYKVDVNSEIDKSGKILYYKHKPGIQEMKTIYDRKESIVHFYINKNGFRNREINLLKDRYRIICLGSSSTVGLESPDDQTWPVYLEQFLSKNVEVINMGQPGFTALDIFNLFSTEGYLYKPDLVILYMGRNDICFQPRLCVLDKWYRKLIYRIHSILYYKIMLYTYLIDKIFLLIREEAHPVFFTLYNPFPEFLKNCKKILDFCDAYKINVVYICEIANYNGNAQHCIGLLKQLLKDSNFYSPTKQISKESNIINLFKAQEIIKEICKGYKNVQFIDPRLEFYEAMLKDNKHHFFTLNNMDIIHLTPFGNRVLAEIISKKIKLIGLEEN